MALAEIRAAIASAMTQVTAVGKVNAYEPLATREEDFRTFFLDPLLDYVQGWSITREMTTERDRDTESNMSTHLMVIRGYRALGLSGGTEEAFQDIVEAVRTRLRREQREQLGGEATFVGPPSVRILEPRMFGSYLVHYVEILLPVTESILVSP
jgi:hypothetical protein